MSQAALSFWSKAKWKTCAPPCGSDCPSDLQSWEWTETGVEQAREQQYFIHCGVVIVPASRLCNLHDTQLKMVAVWHSRMSGEVLRAASPVSTPPAGKDAERMGESGGVAAFFKT
eukprot:45547-Pelagomonas_calceolata.AAC.1